MSTQNEMQRLRDDLAIRAVLAEYCLRLEVNEFSEWLELFTEDCVYKVFGKTLHGREELGAMLSQAPHGIHLSGSPRIELDGDVAHTVQNYIFINGETREMNMGWYYDTLRRTPDGWKIQAATLKFYK